MRIAFVASAVPRRCGIATFTADLIAAVKAADPEVRTVQAAIDEPITARAYGPEVKWRILQGDEASYRAAGRAIDSSSADVVNLQHEFGLYGVHRDGTYHDHTTALLSELHKPVITTLHTVLPKPEPWMRDTLRRVADQSTVVVVMAETAARLLRDVYGITKPPVVIPHGMPAIVPRGRHRLKRQLGVENRTIVSTFGLVDPRKGLEYMIEAMPSIVARFPNTLYLIVGQTHPELLKQEGERYRNQLAAEIDRLGLGDRVRFVNQYLTQREIVDYLLATDVYVTPYLDLNQITSGTLAYALGAGKAIVSTRYLHAAEALDEGRGLLVDPRDAPALSRAVLAVLDDPALKRELEQRAYDYGKEMAWPNVGRRVLALTQEVIRGESEREPAKAETEPPTEAHIG
ncbi:MAG TPA: glycosyltransferase family 4 protein [Candidatus Limnocylindria bacterium]|nr:glycosyltransferase family 4 protein [Candidatus Limnocylindria bacterium]